MGTAGIFLDAFWKLIEISLIGFLGLRFVSWIKNPIELIAVEKAGEGAARIIKSVGAVKRSKDGEKIWIGFKNGSRLTPLPLDETYVPNANVKGDVKCYIKEGEKVAVENRKTFWDNLEKTFVPTGGLGGFIGRKTLFAIWNNGELTPAPVTVTNNPHDHINVLASLQYLGQKKQAFTMDIRNTAERYKSESTLQKYAPQMMMYTIIIIGIVFLAIVVMEFIKSGGGGGSGGGGFISGIVNKVT